MTSLLGFTNPLTRLLKKILQLQFILWIGNTHNPPKRGIHLSSQHVHVLKEKKMFISVEDKKDKSIVQWGSSLSERAQRST